jgi:hypothetical protein
MKSKEFSHQTPADSDHGASRYDHLDDMLPKDEPEAPVAPEPEPEPVRYTTAELIGIFQLLQAGFVAADFD